MTRSSDCADCAHHSSVSHEAVPIPTTPAFNKGGHTASSPAQVPLPQTPGSSETAFTNGSDILSAKSTAASDNTVSSIDPRNTDISLRPGHPTNDEELEFISAIITPVPTTPAPAPSEKGQLELQALASDTHKTTDLSGAKSIPLNTNNTPNGPLAIVYGLIVLVISLVLDMGLAVISVNLLGTLRSATEPRFWTIELFILASFLEAACDCFGLLYLSRYLGGLSRRQISRTENNNQHASRTDSFKALVRANISVTILLMAYLYAVNFVHDQLAWGVQQGVVEMAIAGVMVFAGIVGVSYFCGLREQE